nr:divalent-cation tolerance protein CutA [Halopenitus persicus]
MTDGMPTLYVTAPRDHASRIAETVVEERLAACVNRVRCRSTYRWDGEVVADEETILLIKTTADAADALGDRIRELHPHDVPCIERFDAADVNAPFAAWIDESVAVEE